MIEHDVITAYGILVWFAWGFFMGLGWAIANTLWSNAVARFG